MILMAIDHVRVYSGLPAGGDSPGIFFTRWITHFCAPGFVFFAGTSAFLYGKRIANKGKLPGFLVTRGLMLVLLELTLIRFSWTFNFNYAEFVLAGVIWMLGWCMILLAALTWFRQVIVGIIGLFIIFGQQAFQYIGRALPGSVAGYWEFVYTSQEVAIPGGINILYVLVPWIGVMAAGYGFGLILAMDAAKRRRVCLWIGLSATALFLAIGSFIALRGTPGDDSPAFIYRLLNQRKYPASPLYLLMTLGPTIALMPYAEKARGWLARVFIVFGRVPFFYYLLHIPLIHLSALAVNCITKGNGHQEWYVTAPYTFLPEEQRWSLGLLYLVFFVDMLILYFVCRWYERYKFAHVENRLLKFI